MRYNTQNNGAMDPRMQTAYSQPLTPYIHPANPEVAYGQSRGPAGDASPPTSTMTNVSYQNDHPYVGSLNVPLEYWGHDPGVSRTGSNYVVHQTWQVDTGAEVVMQRYIHRLTDEEKRQMHILPAHRPIFMCKVPGCPKWLYSKNQIKRHLQEHNIIFRKPFRCMCGSEFGRGVEAERHIEDQRPCDVCHRSGRKTKNGLTCRRCRQQTT